MGNRPGPRLGLLSMAILALTASIGTIGANSLALGPIAPAIGAGFNTDVVSVMNAAAAYGIGTALGALVLSPLIDLIGSQKALVSSLCCIALSFLLSALASDLMVFIACQTLAGFSAGLSLPAIYAYAAQIAPQGRSSEILGRVLTGWTISLVAGVSFSAYIADTVGWRWVYVIFFLFTVIALLLLLQVSKRLTTSPDQQQQAGTYETKIRFSRIVWPHTTLKLPNVVFLLMVCFGYMLAFYGVYSFIGSHINESLGYAVKFNGLIALGYGFGFAIAAIGDQVIDRIGVKKTMPIAFGLLALVYVSLALGLNYFWLLVALSILWGLMNHFCLNLIVASLSAIDNEKIGAILGAYSATTYIAASVGALLFGMLYQHHGFTVLPVCSALLLFIACVAVWQWTSKY